MKRIKTLKELQALYNTPLFALISKANETHKLHHRLGEIQTCHLISIKTGGCIEDCKYCAQSSRYQTSVKPTPLMKIERVIAEAKEAKKRGSTRVCLGAAWRLVSRENQFEQVLGMVKAIAALDLEVCCTLGFINEEQASRLKKAGLYAYNHNLDSSENFYKTIITTRSYEDRLKTLDIVQKAHLSVCCGGIIGMGESTEDRLNLLLTLSNRDPQPESVPINLLSPVKGTPLEKEPPVVFWDLLRIVALARILLPLSMVRLSAGRSNLSYEQQMLCFFAGANSIFEGEKLLTVKNNAPKSDQDMFEILGLSRRPSYDSCPA